MTNKICLYTDVLIEVIFDALNKTEKVWHVFFQSIFKKFQFVTCTCYYHIFHNNVITVATFATTLKYMKKTMR